MYRGERLVECLGGHVVVDREHARREPRERARCRERRGLGRIRLLQVGDVLRRVRRARVLVGRRTCKCTIGPSADRGDDGRVGHEDVPAQRIRLERSARGLVLLEERQRPRTADRHEQPIEGLGDLRDIRRVVRRVERRVDPSQGPAVTAEVRDKPCRRRPAERVVVHDHHRVPPAELAVGEIARARVPLRAITVEAEEVRRAHLERGVLRPGRAVDERLLRLGLRVVRDGDALIARERADQNLRAVGLDQSPGLGQRPVGTVVGTAIAHNLDRMAGDRSAADAIGGGGTVGLSAVVRDEPRLCTADVGVVPGAERSLAVGHDADPDRVRWGGRA